MPAFVNASNVRSFAGITGISDPWSEGNLGSNIRAASAFLQRATGRQFEEQTGVTKTFTTNGGSYMSIPDLRTATTVTLAGTTLTLTGDSPDAHFIADHLQTGVYIGIQFRPFGRGGGYRSYLSFPSWFDRNLDVAWRRGWDWTSEANDLEIVGDWGHVPLPDDLLYATKTLAAFYTKNPDALLSGFVQTPDGSLVEAGDLPRAVQSFISAWKVSIEAVSV